MKPIRSLAGRAVAVGALALGAVAFGAVAIGVLAIRRMGVQTATFKRVAIHELIVDDLTILRAKDRSLGHDL